MKLENKPVSFKANLKIINYNNQLTKLEVESFEKFAQKLGSEKDKIEIVLSDFFQHSNIAKSSQNVTYTATKGAEKIEAGKSFYTTVMRVGDTTKELVTEVLDDLAKTFYKK